MQDGILKGTGNSRYLKSIADFLTQYPTYEDMVAALVAGTLPIDLNGINTAGWSQVPTYLNKANLLSDSTESAIWGSTGNRTVDAALAELSGGTIENLNFVAGVAQKTGLGNGVETSISVTFPKVPKLLVYQYFRASSPSYTLYCNGPGDLTSNVLTVSLNSIPETTILRLAYAAIC